MTSPTPSESSSRADHVQSDVAGHSARVAAPETGHDVPDPATNRPAPRNKMRGNWRSLLLSMLAVAGVVAVLYAIVPRPSAVTQPPVDVTPVARQMREVHGLTVSVPQLTEPWKATSARHSTTPAPNWYAGYQRTDDQNVFVAVQQIPASTPTDQRQPWVVEAVSQGRPDGESTVGRTRWARYTTSSDPARRGLVGEVGGMTTVVSGLADYATLEAVAASLKPYSG